MSFSEPGISGCLPYSNPGLANPSGEIKIDPPTHHLDRTTYLAKAVDRKWDVIETFPNQPPADTAAVCDLIKNPTTNKMFVIDVKT